MPNYWIKPSGALDDVEALARFKDEVCELVRCLDAKQVIFCGSSQHDECFAQKGPKGGRWGEGGQCPPHVESDGEDDFGASPAIVGE